MKEMGPLRVSEGFSGLGNPREEEALWGRQ